MALSVKGAALRFLKIRPRSIAELRGKLLAKEFPAAEIETTIQEFIATGLLNDRAFTKSWINYRLARPFGFRRIIQELKAKGIDQQIIDEAMAEVKETVNPQETALELARRRFLHLPAELDEQKKKKRVLDFLLRRGFDVDIAIKTVGVIARSAATKQS